MGYYNSYQKTSGGVVTFMYYDQSNQFACSYNDYEKRIIYTDISMINCQPSVYNPNCTIPVINNGQFICYPDQGWNCHLCPNDLPYWNLVKQDDILNFQFQQLDNLNGQQPTPLSSNGWFTGLCDFRIYDCCTDVMYTGSVTTAAVDYFTGIYNTPDYKGQPFYKNIQSIQISVDEVLNLAATQFPGIDCFYLEFRFETSDGSTPSSMVSIFTEPYKLDTCKDTLVIESTFPMLDCNGYYYGSDIIVHDSLNGSYPNGVSFPYSNEYRIPSYLERTGYNIKKEFVGVYPKTTSSQKQDNWKFTTNRLPENVAGQVSDIFTGGTVYINGTEFIVDGDINKNNEVGSQWFLDVDVRQLDCSISFSCDGSAYATGSGGGGSGSGGGNSYTAVQITLGNKICICNEIYFSGTGGPTTVYYSSTQTLPCPLYSDTALTQPIIGFWSDGTYIYSASTGNPVSAIGAPCVSNTPC